MGLRFTSNGCRAATLACLGALAAAGWGGCRRAPEPPKPPPAAPAPLSREKEGPSLELGPQSQAYAAALAEYAEGVRARRTGNMDRALDLWHSAAGQDPALTNLALGLAQEFLQRGDTNRALVNLDRIRGQFSDDPLIQLRLAVDFRRTGRADDAREAALRVLTGGPPSHLAQAVLFDLDARRDGVDVALDLLRIRAGDASRESGFWELVGQCYADILSEHDKLGVKEIAVQTLPLFDVGAALPDAGLRLKLKIASLRMVAGRPEHAVPVLENMIRSNPEAAPAARQLLAAAFEQMNRLDALVPLLDRFVAERPDKPELLVKLAEVHGRLGHRDELRRCLRQARARGAAPYELAQMCQRYQDWEGAEGFLREAVTGPLASPDAYLDLHRVLSGSLKRPRDSLAVLKEAAKRFPTSIPVRLAAADAATEMRDFDQAVALTVEAEKIAKFTEQQAALPGVWFSRGIVLERAGRLDEAEQWLRKVIEAQPRHHPAMNYLSYSWADRNVKLDEALALVRRAIELNPDNSAYLDTLGWVYFRMGRFEDALAETDRALKIEPGEAEILEHRGDILEKLGRAGEARDAWEKALKIDPARAKGIGERLARLPPKEGTGIKKRR